MIQIGAKLSLHGAPAAMHVCIARFIGTRIVINKKKTIQQTIPNWQ